MSFDTSIKVNTKSRQRTARLITSVVIAWTGLSAILAIGVHAQERGLQPGDAAVTSFSGTKTDANVPSGLHPLDRTFIDVEGAVALQIDLSRLGGPPSGQLTGAPNSIAARARDIGQVFGVTAGGGSETTPPDIYAAATSLFGLQIVKEQNGSFNRLVKGEQGARWMPGQFGLSKGGGPAAIWKIGGTSGAISLFANISSAGPGNSGAGLGALAYDPASNQLFATDLSTGLIHRFGLDGKDQGTFDHGQTARPALNLAPVAQSPKRIDIESPDFKVEDPSTWGFADKRRLVFALAIESGRLYYSVAEGPEIWSVGLSPDGSFAGDSRREIEVTTAPAANLITGIAFDGQGRMFVTQRGEIAGSYDYSVFARPQQSAVFQYTWNEQDKSWSPAPEETPVGLKPPHRSTAGGVALGYGYDTAGTIDMGKCRDTLWTSGDHLRDGMDGARVNQGGPRRVTGLQGNAKTLAREGTSGPAAPSLTLTMLELQYRTHAPDETPWDTWYVDTDGTFADGATDGRMGAIAIYSPCDQTSTAPRTIADNLPPLIIPKEPKGPIGIDKICAPGPIGGVITCKISVANLSSSLPGDMLAFSDATTVLSGAGIGGAIPISAVHPDGPDWFCSPTPTVSFACALPPASLPPGAIRSVVVDINTAAMAAAGGLGFRNCASLSAPNFGIACDEGATDIIVKKTAPAACLPGGACTFNLTVTNAGVLPFDGPLTLTDNMFVGGAPVAAPITAIVPALGCGPDPVALPFSCATPMSLGPGASKVFAITVTMPAAPPAYWANNCFAASGPGVPPILPPPGPPGLAGAASCAWVPVGGPAPLSNLRMEKTPLHAAKCGKTFPGPVMACDYEIAIHNDGPSDFAGPLSFSETVPAAATLTNVPAPWACAGGPPGYTCAVPAVAIVSGGQTVVPVRVKIPLAPLEAGGCVVPNSAAILTPAGGTDLNFNAADDSAIAFADAFMSWILPDGTHFVTCDPTNIQTKKVSKGPCTKVSGGYSCDYVVTLTNTGPDPYVGPVKLDEKFSVIPASATFSAPWSCVPGGSSYQCSHPEVNLQKGDSLSLNVTATLPEGPTCRLSNTANMTFPLAGTRFNKDAADDSASASSKVPSPSCDRPVETDCEKGTRRNANGACEAIEIDRCPDGQPVPLNGRCPARVSEPEPQPQSCTPRRGEIVVDGQCVCPNGGVWDGGCRELITTPDPDPSCRRGDDACFCRDKGGRWTGKRCVEPSNPADDCRKQDRIWTGNRCIDPPNPADQCRKSGGKWTGKRCIRPPATCAEGTTGVPPNCKPIEQKKCPLGTIGSYPNCRKIEVKQCPPGTRGSYPNCVVIEIKRCPPGTLGIFPNCQKIETRRCPPGTIGRYPACEKIQIKPQKIPPPKKIDLPKPIQPKVIQPNVISPKVLIPKTEPDIR